MHYSLSFSTSVHVLVCKCGFRVGVFFPLPPPFKGQCDIFVPKVSLHSSMWSLVANLKSTNMTVAACRRC